MTKPFTGTQAELADELHREAYKPISKEYRSDYQVGYDNGMQDVWQKAVDLVRNAIIEESKP